MIEIYFEKIENKLCNFINIKKDVDKYEVKGEFKVGIRSYLSDENNQFICALDNDLTVESAVKKIDSIPHSFVFLSSSSRFCFSDSNAVCYTGGRKFYYPISNSKGLYIFASMYKKNKHKYSPVFIKNYIRVSSYYERLNMFPKIYGWCYTDVNCRINRSELGRSSFDLEDESVFTMITERLYPPLYKLDFKNDMHRKIFEMVWNDKKIRPYHLPKRYLNALYEENFCDRHPDFNEKGRKDFCKNIRKLYKKNKYHQKLRNRNHKKKGIHEDPNLKYGNVIYCIKNKKWFYIDME